MRNLNSPFILIAISLVSFATTAQGQGQAPLQPDATADSTLSNRSSEGLFVPGLVAENTYAANQVNMQPEYMQIAPGETAGPLDTNPITGCSGYSNRIQNLSSCSGATSSGQRRPYPTSPNYPTQNNSNSQAAPLLKLPNWWGDARQKHQPIWTSYRGNCTPQMPSDSGTPCTAATRPPQATIPAPIGGISCNPKKRKCIRKNPMTPDTDDLPILYRSGKGFIKLNPNGGEQYSWDRLYNQPPDNDF